MTGILIEVSLSIVPVVAALARAVVELTVALISLSKTGAMPVIKLVT